MGLKRLCEDSPIGSHWIDLCDIFFCQIHSRQLHGPFVGIPHQSVEEMHYLALKGPIRTKPTFPDPAPCRPRASSRADGWGRRS